MKHPNKSTNAAKTAFLRLSDAALGFYSVIFMITMGWDIIAVALSRGSWTLVSVGRRGQGLTAGY